MKTRYFFLLFAFCFNSAWADFSNASFLAHPSFPSASDPYLIDIKGIWPTDCHPGEQKPVIREYDGYSVLIEFETIIEHVTCNDVATPYRVLIDMSDVADRQGSGMTITMRFGGVEFEEYVSLICSIVDGPCPDEWSIKPEAGLYYSDGLEKQGLLLARQNQRMGAFPLIYDGLRVGQ